MITSPQNLKVKRIRGLLENRKNRQQEKVFVIEGVRLTEEALKSDSQIELVLYSAELSTRGLALIAQFSEMGCPVEEVDAGILRSLSETETSQGILAVLPQPVSELPKTWDLLLVLDRIRDPGNLGTMLRSAAGAGVQAVVLTPGSVDAFGPKVVRAAMGAHFRLPILTLDWPEIIAACRQSDPRPAALLVADSAGGDPCWDADLRQRLALVIGSEADGPQQAALEAANGLVHIPMPGKAESLNAAVAAAILLYEVVRQRNL